VSEEGSSADGWVLDAWRSTRDELVFFARTARTFALGPASFSRDWVNGAIRPMNPLGYLSFCLLCQAPVQIALLWRMRAELERETQLLHVSSESFDLLRAAAPYVLPLLLCLLLHPFLRLLGSTRRLATTLGIMLYTEGPAVVFEYLAAPARYWAFGHPVALAHRLDNYCAGVAGLPFFAYLVIGMSAAHGLRAWRSATALALAFVSFALVSMVLAVALVVARR
jgi:hypothetical protein